MSLIDNALSLLNFRSTFTATIKNRINHSMIYWSCNCQCKGVIRPCDKTVLHNITVLIIIMCNFVELDSWTIVWLGIWTTIHLCNECHQTSNIWRTKFHVLNVSRLVACSCLCLVHLSQVFSREWRCSWSSAGRRCSNYVWMINNFNAYLEATYIRSLMVCCDDHKAIVAA